MKRLALLAVAALLPASALLADFSYEQSSKLTGGMMAGMMKVAGVFSKQAREPIHTSVLVKGDRLANVGPQSAHIIDLSKETITEVNYQKKTYSVVTFAQMAQAMKDLEASLKNEKGDEQMDITVNASVKDLGKTQQISGVDTHAMLVTVEMEGTDKKTGKKGTFMTMNAEVWLAPQISGYQEVRDFYQRMAQKMSWMPGSGMFAAMRPDSAKGISEMYKQMSKLEGVPVLQTTKMGFKAEGQQPQPGQAAAQPQQAPPAPQPQAEPEKPTAGGALGRLGGRFGGLGGLARRKKQDQEQPQAQPAASQPAQQQGPPPDASGSLMEMVTELAGFSSAAVDASKFEVPSGFKQVESETLKQMRPRK